MGLKHGYYIGQNASWLFNTSLEEWGCLRGSSRSLGQWGSNRIIPCWNYRNLGIAGGKGENKNWILMTVVLTSYDVKCDVACQT